MAKENYWLQTHRGWDPGAIEVARILSKSLCAPLFSTQWSRLLVDCNRDENHAEVFGSISRNWDEASRLEVIEKFHKPYRREVHDQIASLISDGFHVLHISLHSFTPLLKGRVRNCELGIMFDDRIRAERKMAVELSLELRKVDPKFRTKLNYPYVGKSTYFQPYLRRQFPCARYLALQIEVNQKIPRQQTARWSRLQRVLIEAIAKL